MALFPEYCEYWHLSWYSSTVVCPLHPVWAFIAMSVSLRSHDLETQMMVMGTTMSQWKLHSLRAQSGIGNVICIVTQLVHITTVWVSSLTLDCNGVFAIKAYASTCWLTDWGPGVDWQWSVRNPPSYQTAQTEGQRPTCSSGAPQTALKSQGFLDTTTIHSFIHFNITFHVDRSHDMARTQTK